MPPKKSVTSKKASAPPSHLSYKDMIRDAILNLKERNGSSRQAIKKYIQANNSINAPSLRTFDSQFNRQLKSGVDAGDFTQPKGPSGPVKLVKKGLKPSTTKKVAAPKKDTAKKEAAPKKESATKKASTGASTTTAATKKTPSKTKANASKPRKTTTVAPAVEEKKTVTNTTKSGRVTKTRAQPETARVAPARKATGRKTAASKKAAAAAESDGSLEVA